MSMNLYVEATRKATEEDWKRFRQVCEVMFGRSSSTKPVQEVPAAVRVPVAALEALCNPFRTTPWTRRVTRKMVEACLEAGTLHAEPLDGNPDVPARLHASRIAYLVMHGWKDAVQIDVGVPSLGCHVRWPVQDGNHRVAAAIYRGDEEILADVDGSVAYAMELLGVGIEMAEAVDDQAPAAMEPECSDLGDRTQRSLYL